MPWRCQQQPDVQAPPVAVAIMTFGGRGTVGGGAKRYSTRMKYRIENTRAVYVRSGFCYEAQYRLG